ncbi:MAG: hypothetical protein C4526_02145 [Nitrospiraceae bacterium]|nr:MAG: hypothetical protein C4526_02145 [Nitrospiraceae bacterium]
MLSKNNKPVSQKKYSLALPVLGLFFIFLSFVPDLLGIGSKGLGYTELFFIRNGFVLIITGLTLLLFPGLINYFKKKFNDNEYMLERKGDLANRPSVSKYDLIMLLLFLTASNLFAIHIVGKQNYIFSWDSAIFPEKYAGISTVFKANPVHAILIVLGSIQFDHYNLLAPFLLTPFSLLFGTQRLSFILSMVNIFLFFSAIFFLLLYKRSAAMLYNDRIPISASFVALFTFFSFTFIWVPLLDGYVGIGGFFIICLILFSYFKYPFPAQRYRTLVFLAILVPVLVIFRQYYIFWAASFFIALIINEYIFLFIEHRFDRERLLVLSKKLLFTIFISGFFFIMIAGPFLIKIFIGDYSYITAYKFSDTTLQDFKRFLAHFGFLYIAMALLGVFVSFYYRNTRKLASFLLIQWAFTFFLFTRIHSFFPHHYDILIPTIVLFISLFITGIILNVKSRTVRATICSVYILIASLNFSAVFSPEAAPYTKQAKTLFPINRYEPPVRHDIPEIKRMLSVIRGLLTDPDDRLYVLAGNDLLNSEIIEKAYLSLPDTPYMGNHIYRSGALDQKDGFPNALFKARYVLVTDPVQHDFSREQTLTVVIPAESILNGKDMGASYRRLPYEFNLTLEKKKAKVYLYERIGSFNQSDVDFLSNELRKYYPDKPFVYQPNMSDTYTTGR